MTLTIKQHDTGQSVSDKLTIKDTPVDLTGASVVLIISPMGSIAGARRTATIVDHVSGSVSYQFTADDTELAGIYRMEWEITMSGGDVITVPNDGYITLRISQDLG